MNGQGRPKAVLARLHRRLTIFVLRLCMFCCALGLGAHPFEAVAFGANDEIDLRLRIVWHGPHPKLWRGTIGVSGGQLSDLRLLGMEADQQSCFVIPQGKPVGSLAVSASRAAAEHLYVSSRSPGTRYGIDVHVRGSSTESLAIDFNRMQPIRIPLRELIDKPYENDLGDGYKLRVVRAPGDRIRIRTARDSMVFWPGEKMKIDAVAHEVNARPGSTLSTRFRIRRAGQRKSKVALWSLGDEDRALWTHEQSVKVDSSGIARPITNVEVDIPTQPGVYNLDIDLVAPLRHVVGSLAKRRVQFIVVSKSDVASDVRDAPREPEVVEFNPVEPKKIYDLTPHLPQVQWPLSTRSQQRGPWGSGPSKPWDHGGKRWTRLDAGDWHAYSLRVRKIGVPHIVDIEFPTNFAQSLVVSVLEPGNDTVETSVLHSGLFVGDPDIQLTQDANETTRHRIVFWPQSPNAIVMIANRSAESAAAFGRIRVEAYSSGLPRDAKSDHFGPDKVHRKRFAVMNAEQLKHLFSATRARTVEESVAPLVDDSQYDDWRTFEDIADRLVSYLRFAGYDGVALTAWGKGSSLYPSERLNPTPRYDQGVLSSRGQDPYRKDVLEFLFRVFDREGLTLIPALEFSSPLTELEQQLPLGAPSTGIELIDLGVLTPDGKLKRLFGETLKQGDAAPYYNPLDDRVQSAMQNVVEELVERYGKHASFGGIRIELAGRGFTQLPGIGWGFDAKTMENFHQSLRNGTVKSKADRKFVTPISAEDTRRRLRQQVLSGQRSALIQAWIRWRQQRLSNFYDQLASAVIASPGPDANFQPNFQQEFDKGVDGIQRAERKLYLSAAGLLDSAPWQRHLRPRLPREVGVSTVMQESGIDLDALQSNPKLTVLRPQSLGSLENLASQAVIMESRTQAVQQAFAISKSRATEFRHHAETFELGQLNASPRKFALPSTGQYVVSYDGRNARRPYAQSLSHSDDQVLFEGGVAVPLGQENTVRRFLEVYRQLPAVPFQTLEMRDASPLVMRSASFEGQTFVYAVNASPWVVNASFRWNEGREKSGEKVDARGVVQNRAVPSRAASQAELREEDIEVLGAIDSRVAKSFGHLDVNAVVEPYGLVLFKLASPTAQLEDSRTELPASIDKRQRLRVHLDDVTLRAEALKEQAERVPLVVDPSFELPIQIANQTPADQDAIAIPAWVASTDGGTVERDFRSSANGKSSLRMQAKTDAVSITSRPFAVPATGRLTFSFQLRAARAMESPLAVQVSASDANYVSNIRIEKKLTTEFQEASVTFSDLPVDAGDMRLSFQMVAAGEVWIDELHTSNQSLTPEEKKELERILNVTYDQLDVGDLLACYDTLSGYWPRFLLRHVKPPEVAPRIDVLPERTARREPKKQPLFDRFKKYVPRIRFR